MAEDLNETQLAETQEQSESDSDASIQDVIFAKLEPAYAGLPIITLKLDQTVLSFYYYLNFDLNILLLPKVTLGRHPECNIVFQHPAVSSKHCNLMTRKQTGTDEYQLVLGDTSRNGCMVNSDKVKGEERILVNGDQISLIPTKKKTKETQPSPVYTVQIIPHSPSNLKKRSREEDFDHFIDNLTHASPSKKMKLTNNSDTDANNKLTDNDDNMGILIADENNNNVNVDMKQIEDNTSSTNNANSNNNKNDNNANINNNNNNDDDDNVSMTHENNNNTSGMMSICTPINVDNPEQKVSTSTSASTLTPVHMQIDSMQTNTDTNIATTDKDTNITNAQFNPMDIRNLLNFDSNTNTNNDISNIDNNTVTHHTDTNIYNEKEKETQNIDTITNTNTTSNSNSNSSNNNNINNNNTMTTSSSSNMTSSSNCYIDI